MIDLFAQFVKLPVIPAPPKRDRPRVTSEKRRAQMHQHYLNNKAAYAARYKRWVAENPEKAREAFKQSERRRRAAKT